MVESTPPTGRTVRGLTAASYTLHTSCQSGGRPARSVTVAETPPAQPADHRERHTEPQHHRILDHQQRTHHAQ